MAACWVNCLSATLSGDSGISITSPGGFSALPSVNNIIFYATELLVSNNCVSIFVIIVYVVISEVMFVASPLFLRMDFVSAPDWFNLLSYL